MELPLINPAATSLDLSGKKLTSLPEEVTQLTNLADLDLSNNELTGLPLLRGETENR